MKIDFFSMFVHTKLHWKEVNPINSDKIQAIKKIYDLKE
jgi:hypothetical protein